MPATLGPWILLTATLVFVTCAPSVTPRRPVSGTMRALKAGEADVEDSAAVTLLRVGGPADTGNCSVKTHEMTSRQKPTARRLRSRREPPTLLSLATATLLSTVTLSSVTLGVPGGGNEAFTSACTMARASAAASAASASRSYADLGISERTTERSEVPRTDWGSTSSGRRLGDAVDEADPV